MAETSDAILIVRGRPGGLTAAFGRLAANRYARTAHVMRESRHIREIAHADGIARDAPHRQVAERSEADSFRCLAWLYDGFPFSTGREATARARFARRPDLREDRSGLSGVAGRAPSRTSEHSTRE